MRISFMFVILLSSLSCFASGAEKPHVKIICPYDDFGEEEMSFELNEGRVRGELVSPYLYYEVDLSQPKTDIQYQTNGNLESFYFEGINTDNEFISFSFKNEESGDGIGHTKSKVIGNRVFLCNPSL